jgi:hypothetical protein
MIATAGSSAKTSSSNQPFAGTVEAADEEGTTASYAIPRRTASRARTVLGRDGEVVPVDAVDDPRGIGKDAVRLPNCSPAEPPLRPLGRLLAVRGSSSGGERADDDSP